jgi:hypothetical protein
MTGRPSKIHDVDLGLLGRRITSGLPVTLVTEAMGIDRKTYYNWLERGEKGEAPFDVFFHTVKAAQLVCAEILLGKMHAEGPGWTKYGWHLERIMPTHFGRAPQEIQHVGKDGGPLVVGMNYQECQAFLREMEESDGDG